MKSLAFAAAALPLLTVAVAAQADPDVAALQKQVKQLSSRMDRMQKDIDHLRAAAPAASAAGTATAAATPPPAPAPGKPAKENLIPVKGWKVEFVPIEDPQKDPVGSLIWDKADFDFSLHTKKVQGESLYLYRGAAYFHPDRQARYVFQLTLDPIRPVENSWATFICKGDIKIKDEVITEGEASAGGAPNNFDKAGESHLATTSSGGTLLEPSKKTGEDQDYLITFEVSCAYGNNRETHLSDLYYNHWMHNRFSIKVKGPDDDAPRPFEADELYSYVKPKPSR